MSTQPSNNARVTRTLTEAQVAPVLEPLCQATETLFEPVPLDEYDSLLIDLDDTGEYFMVEACGLWPTTMMSDDDTIVDGTRYRKRSASGAAAQRWQKRVPERKELGYGNWKLAATDFTALVITAVWPTNRIHFNSEEAQLKFNFLVLRFMKQSKGAVIIAEHQEWYDVMEEDGVTPKLKLDEASGKMVQVRAMRYREPVMPPDFVDRPERPLAAYQKIGLLVSLQQEGKALFMEQGTGKTAVVVARTNLEGWRKRNGKIPGVKAGMYRVLVLCPQHLRMNWEKEFFRFSPHPGKVSVLRGGPVERYKGLVDAVRNEDDCVWSAAIMSIDSWETMSQDPTDPENKTLYGPLCKVPWDLVVIDESHYIKWHRSKRAQTAMRFAHEIYEKRDEAGNLITARTMSRQRMCLSGTPICNTPFDIYSQLEFLGKGMSGFLTYNEFGKFHGKFEKIQAGATPIQKLVALRGVPLIQERLARLAFMVRKDEAGLQLPDKTYELYEVEMSSQQSKLYKDLKDLLVAEIEEGLESKAITAQHALVKLLRLAQITSGHVRWDGEVDLETGVEVGGRVEQIPGGNPKIDALVQIHKARMNEEEETYSKNGKAIVWCCFIEDMRAIAERFVKEGIPFVGYHKAIPQEYRCKSVGEAVDKYNAHNGNVWFIGNPQSAGEGQTIIGYDREHPETSEYNTDLEVFFSCNWSMKDRLQAEDRAHRRGTRMPVQIMDLVIPSTIDEDIRARVMAKKNTALLIQDVREILNALKGKDYHADEE